MSRTSQSIATAPERTLTVTVSWSSCLGQLELGAKRAGGARELGVEADKGQLRACDVAGTAFAFEVRAEGGHAVGGEVGAAAFQAVRDQRDFRGFTAPRGRCRCIEAPACFVEEELDEVGDPVRVVGGKLVEGCEGVGVERGLVQRTRVGVVLVRDPSL